jgi:hypothetical protein
MVIKRIALVLSAMCFIMGTSLSMHNNNTMLTARPELRFPYLGVEHTKKLLFKTELSNYSIDGSAINLSVMQEMIKRKYDDLVRNHYSIKHYLVYIDDTLKWGVFAADDIPVGSYIGEYTGVVVKEEEVASLDYCYDYIDREFAIDSYQQGNFTRFINHSYLPNVCSEWIEVDGVWHLIYIAIKAIKRGEQLVENYTAGYWAARNRNPVEAVYSLT